MIFRQAEWSDEPMIALFIQKGFGRDARFKYPERFQWLFKDNPFLVSKEKLPIWIAIYEGNIIGMACLMMQDFEVGHQNLKMAWCVDFRVLPEFRGRGAGKQLQEMRQKYISTISLSSSTASAQVKMKLGNSVKAVHTLYLHVRRFDSIFLYNDLMRLLSIKNGSKFYALCRWLRADTIVSNLLLFLFKFKQKKFLKLNKCDSMDLSFEPVDCFGAEADILWKQVKGKENYSFAVSRSSHYLNWKFVNQPNITYQRYLVYCNDELCGILIFRVGRDPEPPIGVISECYTNKNDICLKQMIIFAAEILYVQGATMIECSSSTVERNKILNDLGFISARKDLSNFYLVENNVKSLREEILKGRWFFGLGDHEHDEYPRLKHPSLVWLLKIVLGKFPGYKAEI